MPNTPRNTPSSGAMTLGEVARLIEALREDTTTRFDRIESKFDRLDSVYVRKETYEALATSTAVLVEGLRTDIGRLQNAQSWLLRALGGAVIVALVGAFFAASQFVTP